MISFDTIQPALDLLREGKVQVLLGQKYFGWGSESVKLLYDIKHGKPPASAIIDSGVDVVTKDNLSGIRAGVEKDGERRLNQSDDSAIKRSNVSSGQVRERRDRDVGRRALASGPTPTLRIPARRAASTPAAASSTTTEPPGLASSRRAAVRKTSGSGLPWTTSSDDTMASK